MIAHVKLIALLIALSLSISAQITGKVTAIADGDTLTVLTSDKRQIRVRLAGIDAPERTQDYYARSKQNLSKLVFGKEVELHGEKIDRYGRLVAKVLIDGADANLAQVQAGLAWHYKAYQNEQTAADRKLYDQAERSARAAKLNIWSYHNPQAPWSFRSGEIAFITPTSSNQGTIVGNKNSKIYHWPGCPSYNKVAPKNRVYFNTPAQAETAGYRAARNCQGPPPR